MWNQHSSIEAFRSRWTNDWAVFELRSSSSEFHLRQDIQKGLPNTAKTGLGYKVWYWNVLKVGADHERMGSHWLSIYQRAMCLLSYRVRSCKSWWIFQQSWCLSFLWSRVLWTTLNIIESNKNRYDMIWLCFGIQKNERTLPWICLLQQATVRGYLRIPGARCAGCPCVTPAGKGRRETLGLPFQPHHFGVHQGGRQWLSSNVYTNQHEATVFETVWTCSFNMFQCI